MLEIPIWVFVLYSFTLMLATYLVYNRIIRKNRWSINRATHQFPWVGGTGTEAEELLEAAWMGRTETVKLLVEKGVNVDVTDGLGWTPLHEAAWMGKTEVLKLLIEKGADINAADKDGNTPLHRASRRGRTDALRLLMEKGADLNAADKDGNTPLRWAELEGRTDALRLLKKGTTRIKPTGGHGNYVLA